MADDLIINPTQDKCRDALSAFWNHVCETNKIEDGVAIALPLLMVDGWQTVVHLHCKTPGCITISDGGKLSTWLAVRGANPDSDYIRSILQESMIKFGIKEDETGFYKHVRIPMHAREIHLFGEFISSMSHLVYRVPSVHPVQYVAYSTLIEIVKSLKHEPLEHVSYQTPYRKIRVDLTVQGKGQSMLFQTFDQRNRAGDIMEIWSYRLREISNTSPGMYKTGLIYNEDIFQPDISVFKLAKENCDLVCPSHRTDEIHDFIQASVA